MLYNLSRPYIGRKDTISTSLQCVQPQADSLHTLKYDIKKRDVAMGYMGGAGVGSCAGAGYGGLGTGIGIILVLFILLVIISRAWAY